MKAATLCQFAKRSQPASLYLLALLLGVVSLFTSGCGGSLSSFTGGGIPPGRSAVLGQVILSANPTQPVPNATVSITTSTPNGQFLTYQVYTDSNGQFAINGIPTGSVDSPVKVQVLPNDSSLQPQTFSFLLHNNRPTQLVIALLPVGFSATSVAKITVNQVQTSGTPLYKAQAFDAQGNLLAIFPTLIIDGGLATINADGTFSLSSVATNVVPQSITATVPNNTSNPPTATLPISNGGKPTPNPTSSANS